MNLYVLRISGSGKNYQCLVSRGVLSPPALTGPAPTPTPTPGPQIPAQPVTNRPPPTKSHAMELHVPVPFLRPKPGGFTTQSYLRLRGRSSVFHFHSFLNACLLSRVDSGRSLLHRVSSFPIDTVLQRHIFLTKSLRFEVTPTPPSGRYHK